MKKVKAIILEATKNKEAIEKIEQCTCYHCLARFETSQIKEWCDEGLTAICPFCNVDSVLPGVEYQEDFLIESNNYWFETL